MRKHKESYAIGIVIGLFFLLFLVVPLLFSLFNAFIVDGSLSLDNFREVFGARNIWKIFGNSIWVSIVSAAVSVFISFIISYMINYTNVNQSVKSTVAVLMMIPMLLPTITYGFTIIYAIGKQGLMTNFFNLPEIDFYGFNGLLLGYSLYTIPITFLMINNAMKYIDQKYMVVSKLMGDNDWQTFRVTVLSPILPSLLAAFIQAFFMAFTDYGIPSYIGGTYEVIGTVLYNQMLGSLPNFGNGSVIAILMLLPSIVSSIALFIINKQTFSYDSISNMKPSKNKARDIVFGILAVMVVLFIVMIFIPIFIVPFTKSWPYNFSFTLEHLESALSDGSIIRAFSNSITVAFIVAFVGTIVAYLAGILSARSEVSGGMKKSIDVIAMIVNTIPGMVLGLSYLLLFNNSSLKGTFFIIIVADIIHYFSTPYLTIKSSLQKLPRSWGPTSKLMGDSYAKTIWRIITPNVLSSLIEVFSYYFINAMVTISAVIFIVSTHTILITTKIQELQYYNNFNEVFILSIMLFLTNVTVVMISKILQKYFKRNYA